MCRSGYVVLFVTLTCWFAPLSCGLFGPRWDAAALQGEIVLAFQTSVASQPHYEAVRKEAFNISGEVARELRVGFIGPSAPTRSGAGMTSSYDGTAVGWFRFAFSDASNLDVPKLKKTIVGKLEAFCRANQIKASFVVRGIRSDGSFIE